MVTQSRSQINADHKILSICLPMMGQFSCCCKLTIASDQWVAQHSKLSADFALYIFKHVWK